MNTIELSVADTGIRSLPAMANLASVLANYPEGKIWLVENHLNMVSYFLEDRYTKNDERNFWIDFSTYDDFYVGRTWEACWMLRKKTHLRDYVDEKWDSFSQFCIDSLVRGYYIFATINTAYISDYGWSGRHQIFIHGYNYDSDMLLCSDFFGENAKYSRKWIDAYKLNLAYKRLYEVSSIDDFEGLCLWKYDPHTFSFDAEYGVRKLTTLDLHHVRDILHKYLNGKPEKCKNDNQIMCYGIHVYDVLKHYLEYCNMNGNIASVQPIYVVNDHLTILFMLLNVLEINDNCRALYALLDGLQKDWNKLTMNILKYNIYLGTGNDRGKIVNYILQRVSDYAKDERLFISRLIEFIEGCI